MKLPLWVPTRNEVIGRSLKWAWRFAHLLSRLEPFIQRQVMKHVERLPQTDRDWLRFERFIKRWLDEPDEDEHLELVT